MNAVSAHGRSAVRAVRCHIATTTPGVMYGMKKAARKNERPGMLRLSARASARARGIITTTNTTAKIKVTLSAFQKFASLIKYW